MASLAAPTTSSLSSIPLRALYARLLLTRLVDERIQALYQQGLVDTYASCQGHEAAQVGSAMCIKVGQDFTLPYYRDLGVVLTIGMTPYETIRTCLNTDITHDTRDVPDVQKQPLQWSYQKHNMVHGNARAATHILHAAGIAFASKLRKAVAVTVAYCGDGATQEPDFLEGIRFAAQQQLPVVFICEQECSTTYGTDMPSCFETLPTGLTHRRIDGMDAVKVYETMQDILAHVRTGIGPFVLELAVVRSSPLSEHDTLARCKHVLQAQHLWDEEWATQLHTRLNNEIQQATHNALLDAQSSEQ